MSSRKSEQESGRARKRRKKSSPKNQIKKSRSQIEQNKKKIARGVI